MTWQNIGMEEIEEDKLEINSTWLERQYEIEEINQQIDQINNYYNQTREKTTNWWWCFPWDVKD